MSYSSYNDGADKWFLFWTIVSMAAAIYGWIKADVFWNVITALALLTLIIAHIILIIYYKKRKNLIKEQNSSLYELEREKKQLSEQISKYNNQIAILNSLLHSRTPFSLVAQMYANAHSVVFDEDIKLMIRRHNCESTIQINKQRKEEYIKLLTDYEAIRYRYYSLIDKYFNEVRSQLQTEELFVQFLQSTSTKQYIELINQRIQKYKQDKDLAEYRYRHIYALLQSTTPFKETASLITKVDSALFDGAAYFLRYKSPPAPTTADKIEKEFKQEYIKYRNACEEMMTKYEFLFSVFPDLKHYIDDDLSLISLSNISTIDDFEEETDRVANYLNADEYNRLSQVERNQLALDRYVKKEKDILTIGLEYEMYVDYWLREQGFNTMPHGIIHGVNDLGRDIIAWKNSTGELFNEVYVIQCKLRSQNTVIHENVICQIYGSAIEYELEHPDVQVVPTICTNVLLSDTASKFADKLKVFRIHVPMGNFPRIKCNINNGEKIYHLPFDQQYWRTQIKNKDEFYAWTVQEAENAGFRRAKRHSPFNT